MGKTDNNKWWWVCAETVTLIHCWWKCKFEQTLWKRAWQFLKVKCKFTTWPSNSTYIFQPKKNANTCPHNSCTLMFIAALFTWIKKWNHLMSTHWWMDKQKWYARSMEYCSAIKRDKVFIHPTTQIEVKSIILSERSQTETTTTCMYGWFHLHECSVKANSYRQKVD